MSCSGMPQSAVSVNDRRRTQLGKLTVQIRTKLLQLIKSLSCTSQVYTEMASRCALMSTNFQCLHMNKKPEGRKYNLLDAIKVIIITE